MATKTIKKLKRLAASLIVLRQKNSAIPGDKFEILLVQRSRTMKFATSTWVFPGGVYDKADGDGVEDGLSFAENVDVLRKTCMREAFEETGLLPLSASAAKKAPRDKSSWKEWREKVHDDASQWPTFRNTILSGGSDLFTQVSPICCFLTPEMEAARSGRQYLTHFFVCEVDARNDDPIETLPPWAIADVDDNETVNAEWISPIEAIKRSKAGTLLMFPPQFYLLQRLSAFDSASDAVKGSNWFCSGSGNNGGENKLAIVMQPEGVPGDNSALSLPFDEAHKTHPGPKGALHRIGGFMSKEGMQLMMNDIAAPHVVGNEGLGRWKWPGYVGQDSKM